MNAPRKAAYWYERAAQLGHAKSQLSLSEMYSAGRGVTRNPTTAYKWLAARPGQRPGTTPCAPRRPPSSTSSPPG